MISKDEYWQRFIEYFEKILEQGYTPKKAIALAYDQTEHAILLEAEAEGRKLLGKMGIEAAPEIRKRDLEFRDLLKNNELILNDLKINVNPDFWNKEYLKPAERKELLTLVRAVLGIRIKK